MQPFFFIFSVLFFTCANMVTLGGAQVERRGASYRGADGVEIGEGVSPHNALSEKFPTFWLGLVHLAFIRISDAISQFTRPDYSRSKEKKSPAIQG